MKKPIFILVIFSSIFGNNERDTIYPVLEVFPNKNIQSLKVIKNDTNSFYFSIGLNGMVGQFGFNGAQLVGCERNYKQKIGWGLDIIPELNRSKSIYRFKVGYFENRLEYYSWAVVPNAVKNYYEDNLKYLILGIGYLYKSGYIDISKIIKIMIGTDILLRYNITDSRIRGYYLSPLFAFSILNINTFLQINKNVFPSSWESENISFNIGLYYSLHLFNYF